MTPHPNQTIRIIEFYVRSLVMHGEGLLAICKDETYRKGTVQELRNEMAIFDVMMKPDYDSYPDSRVGLRRYVNDLASLGQALHVFRTAGIGLPDNGTPITSAGALILGQAASKLHYSYWSATGRLTKIDAIVSKMTSWPTFRTEGQPFVCNGTEVSNAATDWIESDGKDDADGTFAQKYVYLVSGGLVIGGGDQPLCGFSLDDATTIGYTFGGVERRPFNPIRGYRNWMLVFSQREDLAVEADYNDLSTIIQKAEGLFIANLQTHY
jgi:hypothetical protein